MYVAFLVAMAVAWALPQFDPVFDGSSMPVGMLVAGTIIFAVGFVDDRKSVSPPAKVAGQVLAGALMSQLGVALLFLRVPFLGTIVLSSELAPLATVVWLIVIANALNLIDGLDGLAAGVVAIAAGSFFLYGHRRFDVGLLDGPASLAPLLAIIAVGACIGFLPHNFHPARIFMGDSGALFLGLLLAGSTLIMSGQSDDTFSGGTFFFFAPVFIPFVILGVPVLDAALAVVRRVRRGQSVFAADREHLHHRLMRLGHGQRRAVVILWMWTAVLSGFVLWPTYHRQGNAVAPFGIAALGVGLFTLFHPSGHKNNVVVRHDVAVLDDDGDQPAAGSVEDLTVQSRVVTGR